MKIAVIVAMRKELDLLLPHLESMSEVTEGDLVMYRGRIGHHEVCAMQCGIGKVNSAVRTWRLIEYFDPELVINTGVAGGASPDMKPLDVVVAEGVTYSDVWCGPGTEFGAAAGFPVVMKAFPIVMDAARSVTPEPKFGLIASSDMFISEAEQVERIVSRCSGAIAVDMESGSIAQVCEMRKIPWGVIRVISDNPCSGANISEYENFWTEAPAETFRLLVRILKML